MELKNKLAVVTGAANGIGWGIANVFKRNGAKLVLVDIDKKLIEEKRKELPEAHWVCADLAKKADLERILEETLEQGTPDVLINNAAIGTYGKTASNIQEEDWDHVLNINLKSNWYLSKLFIPSFQKQKKGCFIYISSVHALMSDTAYFPYSVTKGGINALVRATAIDYGKDGIRSVGIAPGWVKTACVTDFLNSLENSEEEWKKVNAKHLIGRMGQPEEIGEMASFIASDRCSFLNGTIVTVDGGLTTQLK